MKPEQLERKIYDKNGRSIEVGDLLKIFHFVGARRKRYYMYHWVMRREKNDTYFRMSHLNTEGSGYLLRIDDKKHDDIEIVQGYHGGVSFEDRERVK